LASSASWQYRTLPGSEDFITVGKKGILSTSSSLSISMVRGAGTPMLSARPMERSLLYATSMLLQSGSRAKASLQISRLSLDEAR
jgi:hypothetical protein